MSEQQDGGEQKPPRTPPGPPDFVEGPQMPTPEQLADWKRFQQQQEEQPDEETPEEEE